MKVSELMQAMADAGAPMSAILIAVQALEERDEALAVKRAVERDRKRRQRANAQDNDGTVTGQSRDKTGTFQDTPPLDKEIPPKPPKEINPPPISPHSSDEECPPLSVSEVVEGWNGRATRSGLRTVAKLTDARTRQIRRMAKAYPVEDWQSVFAKVEQSPFLRGQNDRGWKADFDFVLNEKNFVKILEGKYDAQSA
jgi:hypothetical protein